MHHPRAPLPLSTGITCPPPPLHQPKNQLPSPSSTPTSSPPPHPARMHSPLSLSRPDLMHKIALFPQRLPPSPSPNYLPLPMQPPTPQRPRASTLRSEER